MWLFKMYLIWSFVNKYNRSNQAHRGNVRVYIGFGNIWF